MKKIILAILIISCLIITCGCQQNNDTPAEVQAILNATPTPELTAQAIFASPPPTNTPLPTVKPSLIPTIVKQPNGMQKSYVSGEDQAFSAKVANWTGVNWHMLYPDGTYYCEASNFGYVDNISVPDVSTLYLTSIPYSLNNYIIYGTFFNDDGAVDSDQVRITVEKKQDVIVIKPDTPAHTHMINISYINTGGYIQLNVENNCAVPGTEVAISAFPSEGYEVQNILISDVDPNQINVKRVSPLDWTFTMPDSDVNLKISFIQDTIIIH